MNQPPFEPADAVLQFLASVGSSSEAEFYLRLFRSRAKESFATIAVDASCLAVDAGGVITDLRFLSSLGLTPVVVVGHDDPAQALAHRDALTERLQAAGVANQALELGVSPETVIQATERGAIPVLSSSQPEPAQRLETLAALLTSLRSHKLIILNPHGGLFVGAERASVVNLSSEYPALLESGTLDTRAARMIEDSRRLIFELVPHRLLVTATSPLNLVQELFTVKGKGTLLRKGARITRCNGWSGVDLTRMRALLESSFGRAPNEHLFTRAIDHAYVEESYRGAAIVMSTPLGGYLSKFAVTREAQGEGIGQDLWGALIADYRALLWRARANNPIRAWYERTCQGRFSSGEWTVYVRGIDPAHISQAIEFALAQPLDF